MVHAFLSCGKLAPVVQTAAARPTTVANVIIALRFQFGECNLGRLIWPFENDLMLVQAPKDNLPLLNDNIRVAHLLNLAILNCEREWRLLPLKQQKEPSGILKERSGLWPQAFGA